MAGIQRFVTYIYAYENGEKRENTGYAKLETRGERGQLEIHFLDGGMYRGAGKIAFLYTENGKLVSIPVGGMPIENGKGNGLFSFQTNRLSDTAIEFAQIDGISITASEKRRYLSFWKDVNVINFNDANFVEYGQRAEGVTFADDRKQDIKPIIEDDMGNQDTAIEDAEQESLHTLEIPMRNIFPTYTLEGVWQNMCKIKVPVQVNDNTVAIQMELSELRELPKQYWYFGNNSFLLHGFFNYHHILFGRMADNIWFIGVPGVYERQERVMASIFGFSGFTYIGEKEAAAPRERQQGIWYHILEP